MSDNRQFLRAVAVLACTTIGAGIYGIPYAISKVGYAAGLLYLLTLGAMVMILNLVYGEIILKTKGDHQLTGYGEIYLGQIGKILASLSLFVGLYGALLAYIIKTGEFLALLIGGQSLFFSIIFFILGSTAVVFGLKTVSRIDLIFFILIQAIILIITVSGLPYFTLENLQLKTGGLTASSLILPYGVILFAISGSSAIPEVEEILRKRHFLLKKAILAGTLVPILVYLWFATTVIGISGKLTSEDSFSGLAYFLPGWIVKMGALLGVITMSTSFLGLGYVLREIWHRDFFIPKPLALALALLPPFDLFLLGAQDFISVLNFTGAITGGLTGIIILVIYAKICKNRKRSLGICLPLWLNIILGAVFFLGMFSPFIR